MSVTALSPGSSNLKVRGRRVGGRVSALNMFQFAAFLKDFRELQSSIGCSNT